jgi:hypothetical protein
MPCFISSRRPKIKRECTGIQHQKYKRNTIRGCLHRDETIKVVLHEDTEGFRASFHGVLEMGYASGEVVECSIRMRKRKIHGWVEGLGGD